MIRAWTNPNSDAEDLFPDVAQKANVLLAAANKGAKFLALPVENNREAASWILASFHSPLAVIPLPAHLPAAALENRLRQMPKGQLIFPADLKASSATELPARKNGKEIWAVIFTSGSSGEPKGVALSGAAFQASASAHAMHLNAANTTWLLDLPLFHVGGLSVITRALFLGSRIALGGEKFDAQSTLAWLKSGKVGGLSLVPTTLYRLLREPGADFSPLDILLLGGGAVDEKLLAEAISRGAPVHRTYGMTEHASQIATEPASGAGMESLPGVELKIQAGGEILVRSACLASGYFSRGELLPLPSEEGFFLTGDLGQWREKSLEVFGRKSELVVSGGKKIFPSEVEPALAQLPGVEEAAVASLPDPEWGEVLCALVVEKRAGSFQSEKAKEALAQNLERHQIPKHWIIVESLPRTEAGKIRRKELRALLEREFKSNRN